MVFVIRHLASIPKFQWIPLYIFAGIFLCFAAAYTMLLLFRNIRLGKHSSRLRGTETSGIMIATVELSRPLTINPGQYVNIWVPSLALFSSHPFTVISWAPFPQKRMELLIEERGGFTAKLFRRLRIEGRLGSREYQQKSQHGYRIFFSGPHGSSMPDWEFDSVLLFASGFGIATILPYLTKLGHSYKQRKGRSKRIHLVWKVYRLGK